MNRGLGSGSRWVSRIPGILLQALCCTAVWTSLQADDSLPASQEEIRIASYNVENYLRMPRRINGRLRASAGKPLPEREAVARVAGELRPDLLGLMEIGDPSEFDDLRRRLRAAGLDYPFSEYLQGADPTRHLALLSRFPIVEKHSLSEIPLRVGGLTLRSLRGILDVTVEPKPGYRIRLLCVHLKAKREVGEYDASSLRDAESRFLADHVKGILKRDPDARLVVMGDFNETKNAAPLRALFGNPGHPGSLRALPLADTRGETWTEYWGEADVYSRIDYMMVSSRLDQEVDSARSGVARPAFWNQASDHCPVYLSINPTP